MLIRVSHCIHLSSIILKLVPDGTYLYQHVQIRDSRSHPVSFNFRRFLHVHRTYTPSGVSAINILSSFMTDISCKVLYCYRNQYRRLALYRLCICKGIFGTFAYRYSDSQMGSDGNLEAAKHPCFDSFGDRLLIQLRTSVLAPLDSERTGQSQRQKKCRLFSWYNTSKDCKSYEKAPITIQCLGEN